MQKTSTETILSVIIPSHNNLELLKKCISSWQNFKSHKTELLLINDGSKDGTAEWGQGIVTQYENVRYFYENDVFETLSNNRGFKEANGKYILVWQDDMILNDPNVIQCSIELLEKENEISVLGLMRGLFIKPITYTPKNYDEFYNSKNTPKYEFGTPTIAREVDLCVRPWIIRKKTIEEVGIFLEKYAPFTVDEWDLHTRIREKGGKIAVIPAERMGAYTHYSNTSTSKHKKEWFENIIYRNFLYFYEDWNTFLAKKRNPAKQWDMPKQNLLTNAKQNFQKNLLHFYTDLYKRKLSKTLRGVKKTFLSRK